MVLWWIILVISVVACIFLAGYVFPKAFLGGSSGGYRAIDRGLRNFKGKDDRAIVYEPAPQYRKYISQYILSVRQGKKAVICKLKENFAFLDYDVVVFNSNNQPFKVINVKENIKTPGFTRITGLPKNTAYISLIINFADSVDVKKELDRESINNAEPSRIALNQKALCREKKAPADRSSYRGLVLYALTAGIIVTLEAFIIKLALSYIFGDVFWEDYIKDLPGMIITLVIGLAAAAAVIVAATVYFVVKNKKGVKNKDNQNQKVIL